MALSLEEILDLPFAIANGNFFIPAQLTLGGTTYRVQLIDVINAVPLPTDMMLKSVYDVNGNNIVDNSEALGGNTPSFYLDIANLNANFSSAQITALNSLLSLSGYVLVSSIGQPNGVAPLNSGGTIDPQYIPLGLFNFAGEWNVFTNVPTLSDSTGVIKDAYIVTTGGTRNLGSGNITWAVGDIAIFDGTVWVRVPVGGTVGVTSWNGVTGAVNVTTANLPPSTNRNYITDIQKLAFDNTATVPSVANPVLLKNDVTFSPINFQNTWNAATNTPTLADGVGTAGFGYIVTTAGTQNLGSGNITYSIGDLVILNAALVWQKVTNIGIGVVSWNGLNGVVVVTTASLPDSANRRYVTDAFLAAMTNANGASGANPFATIADVTFSPISYKNSWNATTNNPVLADGVGTAGDAYIVGTAGTQNLGSGAITFAIGDFVILSAGLIWQKITGAAPGVSSWNALTGAVNVTTAALPDATGFRYVHDISRDGLNYAETLNFPPSTTNAYATRDWVNSIASSLTVTNEWNTPERYGDGVNSVGTSLTPRLLNTLINPTTGVVYTNASAGARWNLVSGINVATWDYDEVCVDQAFRGMELAFGSAAITFHDNRIYLYQQEHNLPGLSQWSSFYKPDTWLIQGNASRHFNRSGVARKMWKRIPANQGEAVSNPNAFTNYKVIIKNISLYGAGLGIKGSGDDPLTICATYGGQIENVTCSSGDVGLNMYFCLHTRVMGGTMGGNSRSGIKCATGFGDGVEAVRWTGASLTNSASNGSFFSPSNVNCPNNAFAAIELYGSDGLTVCGDAGAAFEGAFGTTPQHHIFMDGQMSTLVKIFKASNYHLEQNVSESHICIKNYGQIITATLGEMTPFLTGNPRMFEARTNPSGGGTVSLWINDCPNLDTGWKLRQVGTGSSGRWHLDGVQIYDQNNITAAINWDVSTVGGFTGSIPPAQYAEILRQTP